MLFGKKGCSRQRLLDRAAVRATRGCLAAWSLYACGNCGRDKLTLPEALEASHPYSRYILKVRYRLAAGTIQSGTCLGYICVDVARDGRHVIW